MKSSIEDAGRSGRDTENQREIWSVRSTERSGEEKFEIGNLKKLTGYTEKFEGHPWKIQEYPGEISGSR
jgi:hypothetical protein